MPLDADISANLSTVRRRIEAAAHRVSRTPSEITLVAVSKTFSVDDVRAAHAAGQRSFGENRVQEAEAKTSDLADLALDWHLIGHLQSNKARKAVATFGWIQSVDRIELLSKLDQAASDLGVRRTILLQVDLAHETTKHGADRRDLRALAEAALSSRSLDLAGLMIVPPVPAVPEDSRPWFTRVRELRDELVRDGIPAESVREFSMGMSDDFEVAIEEGATIVRVGSAIFGSRSQDRPFTGPG